MHSNSQGLQGNHPMSTRWTTSSPKASQLYQPFQAGRCFHVAAMSLAGCLPAHSIAQAAACRAEGGGGEEREGRSEFEELRAIENSLPSDSGLKTGTMHSWVSELPL